MINFTLCHTCLTVPQASGHTGHPFYLVLFNSHLLCTGQRNVGGTLNNRSGSIYSNPVPRVPHCAPCVPGTVGLMCAPSCAPWHSPL